MIQIATYTKDGNVEYSQHYDSLWAANIMAYTFAKNYADVVATEVIEWDGNREAGKILKTYTK